MAASTSGPRGFEVLKASPSRQRRPLRTVLFGLGGAVSLVLLAACTPNGAGAETDFAENVTTTAARLSLDGQCGSSSCSHRFAYSAPGVATKYTAPTASHAPNHLQRFNTNVSGLTANKLYTVQACTRDVLGGGQFSSWDCAAPTEFRTTTFNNPLQQPPTGNMKLAAPNMVKVGGYYYTIGSFSDFGNDPTNYQVRRSTDMMTWSPIGLSFTATNSIPDVGNLWVPAWRSTRATTRSTCNDADIKLGGAEIAYLGGTWYLMATFASDVTNPGAACDTTSPYDAITVRSIGIATASNPEGPYTWKATPSDAISDNEDHIDPSLFVDPDDPSSRWLVYSVSYIDDRDNMRLKAYPVDANLDRNGSSVILLRTDVDTKTYELDGPNSYRQEGGAMFKHDGHFFVYYATGNTANAQQGTYPYVMAMARSQTLPPNDAGSGNLFVKTGVEIGNSTGTTWKGPGHGGVIQDARGAFWYVYQAKNGDDQKKGFLQPMYYDQTQHNFYFQGGAIKATNIGVPFP